MKHIIDILTEDYNSYLSASIEGLNMNIEVCYIDFTRGETDISTLLYLKKKELTWNEALIILVQRRLMVWEEWLDFSNYNSDDLIRWTGFLKTDYINSIYCDDISLKNDVDKEFFFDRLNPDRICSIERNNKKIDFSEFKQSTPLLNETIIKISESKFDRLAAEFYIETDNHYLLYYWFTTA